MAKAKQTLYDLAIRESKKKNRDDEKIFGILNESLEEGDARAAYSLGTWYLQGKFVKKNLRTAIQLIKIAAKAKVSDALFDLAVCYEQGIGVKKNEKLAIENYLQAAFYGDAQAHHEVGLCYLYGVGVEKDKRIAEIWFEHAAQLGITD
jgi:TPR repeat protein